ncbi:unnamed protein product [marine sediment metagenome]|uniref:Uncharacterized protein n=1 Tax=marine sediment metagenome TaxID=412755 RepID=X1JGZ4_9ZZZZ
MDKIRLGTVTGDVAVRLGESLRVTGVSIKDFTKEAVEQHLLRTTPQDAASRSVPAASQDVSQDVDQDMIRIVKNPGISTGPCPTCGAPCLTCSDGLMPLSEFADTVREALKEARPWR